MKAASPAMQDYFRNVQEKVDKAYDQATKARLRMLDPENHVDIILAKNMAERVEGLVREVSPNLAGSGMVEQIYEYEKQYNMLDWRVAFKIAEDVAKQKFCKFNTEEEAMEAGIRVGFAYLTLGIVSAPLEGFTFLKIKQRQDGKKYLSLWYSGPVRGAGGTAAATSVVLGDYIRQCMGYDTYDPTEEEISRYVREIQDYHERVTNLQYFPSEDELRFMAKHLPVEINGEPTEIFQVSNHKDLPRVETRYIRGGLCLVIAEGLCQKAPKLWLRLNKWGKDFGLGHWGFMQEFLDLQKAVKARKTKETTKERKITPNYVYIQDLVAGRPVLTYPMRAGGFRLRYGRSRISGFSSASIHPATMHLLNKYIATGTQLKLERPGKATALTPNDAIEGPIVKLIDGSVVRVDTETDAKRCAEFVKEILFLGDILSSYGDFSENGHVLVPAGYNEDIFSAEMEAKLIEKFGAEWKDKLPMGAGPTEAADKNKIENAKGITVPAETIISIVDNPHTTKIDASQSISLSKTFGMPLHPYYTYHWGILSKQELIEFAGWLQQMKVVEENGGLAKIVLPLEDAKKHAETIGLPCVVASKELVILDRDNGLAVMHTLGIENSNDARMALLKIKEMPSDNVLAIINALSKMEIKDKSGTFIGARMGRPEKAKMRRLSNSPHALFPIGDEGGRLRSVQSALESGKVTADFPSYQCPKCGTDSIFAVCIKCRGPTEKVGFCKICGKIPGTFCPRHGEIPGFMHRSIAIKEYFDAELENIGMKTFPDLIKGVRGTSNRNHVSEHLAKGIFRAKYDLYVNKDGTVRYDMTELPLTHFKPKEIGISLGKLKQLGYDKDIHGNKIKDENQIIELKPQDIILPASLGGTDESADDILFRTSKFIDDLLLNFYKMEPFYDFKSKDHLIGELVIGLAPHISAGMIGRIIGFSETQACFAHPYWHAALRRDCDGDECCVMLLMDGLLNFSRQFLPDKRGSRTMDSPLVLTSQLVPAEVDDMVQGLDIAWKYPLELFEAAMNYKPTWEVKVEQVKKRLNTEAQYENFGFTHDVSSINIGIKCSAYKTLPSMEEKLKGQMDIAEKIRAVDQSDVARLVIEKHFLRDTKGNLRKFSQQEFRCVKCNKKFRRPPLAGKCTACGGKLLFTIAEGSVLKYLEPSISLANKYGVPSYLKQTLELTKRRIEGVFGRDPERQAGLGAWFDIEPPSAE
ncbi:DNA polymerase II large subunit [Candidatus Woesearchaeota archaeon]|nr:DNA polymerase II large subunit [Candidatus Woesearchaeota archaeon]